MKLGSLRRPQGYTNNLFPFITHVISGKQKELNVYGNDYNTPDGLVFVITSMYAI